MLIFPRQHQDDNHHLRPFGSKSVEAEVDPSFLAGCTHLHLDFLKIVNFLHIFLVWGAFPLNLVFKFGDFVQRRVKSRAGEPLICGERGERGSQVLSTSKNFTLEKIKKSYTSEN